MIKLFLDWPVGYMHIDNLGQGTFALAQCYLDSEIYRRTLSELQQKGREILLDNGAWEFGTSMDPIKYRDICKSLNPDYVVIPDTLEDMDKTIKQATEFLQNYKPTSTKTMFVPQGRTIKEITKCYNTIMEKFADKIDMLAISKWQCKLLNRITLVDLLLNETNYPLQDVHFLGFSNWDELMVKAEDRSRVDFPHSWNLKSLDTRYPIKRAFGNVTWPTENDYYYTNKILGQGAITAAVKGFEMMLEKSNW